MCFSLWTEQAAVSAGVGDLGVPRRLREPRNLPPVFLGASAREFQNGRKKCQQGLKLRNYQNTVACRSSCEFAKLSAKVLCDSWNCLRICAQSSQASAPSRRNFGCSQSSLAPRLSKFCVCIKRILTNSREHSKTEEDKNTVSVHNTE